MNRKISAILLAMCFLVAPGYAQQNGIEVLQLRPDFYVVAGAGGNVIRRNGTPSSDQATMTTHFLRHGDVLTVLAEIEDPIYFTEPLILSKTFQMDTNPMRPIGPPCVPGYEGTDSTNVQHYLPGQNPFVNEVADLYHIPVEAVLGGAETMYPDYRKKLKDKYVRPEKCVRNCGGPTGAPPGVF